MTKIFPENTKLPRNNIKSQYFVPAIKGHIHNLNIGLWLIRRNYITFLRNSIIYENISIDRRDGESLCVMNFLST